MGFTRDHNMAFNLFTQACGFCYKRWMLVLRSSLLCLRFDERLAMVHTSVFVLADGVGSWASLYWSFPCKVLKGAFLHVHLHRVGSQELFAPRAQKW
jgi:hypothetical protein